MRDYIIQRAEHLLNKLEDDGDKTKYLLGALTELQVLAITFHEWDASDFVEAKINRYIKGRL